MNKTNIVAALLLACLIGNAQALHRRHARTFHETTVGGKNVRTIQLLNQLCNESHDEDSTKRDACYGCFFRASIAPRGYPMLSAMAACSEKYLNNTDYNHCSTYLRGAVVQLEPTGTPMVVYCTFLECIRQVNKDTLIRVCVAEALGMFSSFSLTDVNLAKLFVNTTACILAKTRCAAMNPITGATRGDEAYFTSKLHITSINAILVNTNYDINIVQLPYEYSYIDECAKYRNVQQATWPTVQCSYTSGL